MHHDAPPNAGRRHLLALMASTLSGCAVLSPEPDPSPSAESPAPAGVSIPRFSTAGPGEIPKGWKPWIIHPRKARTEYAVADVQGARVLRARARSSASGLLVPLDADPTEYRRLSWRWRTEGLLHEADNGEAAREDAPLRVVLAFDGDRSKLPVRDRLFFERVKLLAGVDMPYATLMYIWANRHPLESVIENPHTSRVRKIVASSGAERVGRWVALERDVLADYRQAYGEDPGRLVGVSVMSDTDNTSAEVVAYYGDIELLRSS